MGMAKGPAFGSIKRAKKLDGSMMSMYQEKIILVAVLMAASSLVQAADVDYELRLGGIHSDNVRRSGADGEDETIGFVGIGLDVAHESKRVNFSLHTILDWQHYVNDSFDDEVVGALNADLVLAMIPEVLTWVATNRFGQLQTNPFLSDTADNRGNFNSFSTGPDLLLRFGNRMSFGAGGRITRNDFEKRDIDNDVVSGNAFLSRDLSANRSISLSVTFDDIDYRWSIYGKP